MLHIALLTSVFVLVIYFISRFVFSSYAPLEPPREVVLFKSNGYWVDDSGNKWSTCTFNEKEAHVAASSLKECSGCLDCELCSYCTNCEGCRRMVNCSECVSCHNTADCVRCSGCARCVKCSDLKGGKCVWND